MTLTVTYSKASLKALRKMPTKAANSLVAKIDTYAANPKAQHAWAKPLTGIEGVRIRQGDYRAVCNIINNETVFMIYKVGHRKEIYK